MSDNKHLEEIINKEYKLGFETLIQNDTFAKGLNEDVIKAISAKKDEPSWLLVPAITSSLNVLLTGLLSPVIAASSTDELPSIITPSTGMLEPGRINTTSPTRNSLTST